MISYSEFLQLAGRMSDNEIRKRMTTSPDLVNAMLAEHVASELADNMEQQASLVDQFIQQAQEQRDNQPNPLKPEKPKVQKNTLPDYRRY
jgi:hypothetical protein